MWSLRMRQSCRLIFFGTKKNAKIQIVRVQAYHIASTHEMRPSLLLCAASTLWTSSSRAAFAAPLALARARGGSASSSCYTAALVLSPPICRYSYGKNGPPGKRGKGGSSRRRPRPPPPPLPPAGSTLLPPQGRGCFREALPPGANVWVIQKEHQRSGELTAGTVERSLGRQEYHPRGIKVMLRGGIVGRVHRIDEESGGGEEGSGGGGGGGVGAGKT